MGHLDVIKSLLRSAAQSATGPLSRSSVADRLRERLSPLSPLSAEVSEQALTRAISRIPQVTAATVRVTEGRIAVQMDRGPDRPHAVIFEPGPISFAPRGAKEIAFRVTPPEVANLGPTLDACGAIAGEVARAMWQPILRPLPDSDHLAFVHCAGNLLTADLRTVSEVRAAIRNPITGNVIEALMLSSLEPVDGKLRMRLGLISL